MNNSENQYSRYEIQKGDTLESIAQKLNIEIDDLRQYHNARSKIEDCLAGELRSHLKFLIVSNKKEDVIHEEKKQQVLFISQDYVLPFQPFELNHQYNVLCTIQKGEKIQTVEQNFNLRRLRPDSKQEDYHFIQIDKISKVLIDGKAVDTRAYKVAEKTGALLYPLRIVVNKYGKWENLNSYDKLKQRWANQKEEIKASFDGAVYESLANDIANKITDNNALVKHISGDWFLRAFFNGIHMAYTRKFEIEKKLFFPAIAEVEDIEFSIIQKVNPYLNELNLIEISQTGESENEHVEEYYFAKYYLNPNNYIIEHLSIECDLVDMDRKIKIEVKNLNDSKIILDSGISLLV